MKVTVEKLQKGLAAYLANDLTPHLEGGQRFAIGLGGTLAIQNLPNTLKIYASSPLFVMFGVIDDQGMIDIDALHTAAVEYFPEDGQSVDVPYVGKLKFTKQDLENLYQYIKGA